MKNTIKKKNARRTAHILSERVLVTVNYTDVTRYTVFIYPVVGYSANGTRVARFTVYTNTLISRDIIARFVIDNLDNDILVGMKTLTVDSHMIQKEAITNKPQFSHSTVNPWVYKHNHYSLNELELISW